MLVIRLRRIGRKHDPHYRIVVTEHTAPVQGKFLVEIGHYHPKTKQCVIDNQAMVEWMNKGAKPSNTVARLAQKNQIEHKHVVVKQKHAQPKKASDSDARSNSSGLSNSTDIRIPEVTSDEQSAPHETAAPIQDNSELTQDEQNITANNPEQPRS